MNLQWFPGHMAKTRRLMSESLKITDVAAEILDARIPVSSRNPEIDKILGNKPRIVVLNKSDMSDPEMNKKWIEKSTLLNHYYIETRYPADMPFDIDTETIMELIQSSSEMLSFITEIIHFDFRSYHKR